VLGGFHMAKMGKTKISRIVSGLKELPVRRVGPCHCSGDTARQAMQEAYGDDYLEVGVGAHLRFPCMGSE